MNNLSCNCVPRLDGAAAAELGRLFPEPSITAPLLSLLQESGIDGFNLRSIVVLKDDVPILLLPLFETRFDLSTLVEGWLKMPAKAASCLVPMLFHPRILGVGLLIGECSEIGIDPQIDVDTLDAACETALGALQKLAAELRSDFVAFYNFSRNSRLPEQVSSQFNQVPCQSCAQLPIDFSSVEEFLARLSRSARKDLNRKMRTSHEVRVIRSRNIASFLDRIYKLYLETTARSPLTFGVHNRLFFEKICERIPGAEYMLYFVQEELAAFNLLVVRPEAMVDEYFCMDYELGRKHNLYVLSWLENVRCCVELKIPVYHAGQGAENIKAHLGATFIRSFIFFKHRQPIIDRLLVRLPAVNQRIARRLGFWPAVSDISVDDRQEYRPKKPDVMTFNTVAP
jgi:hypothetical protein